MVSSFVQWFGLLFENIGVCSSLYCSHIDALGFLLDERKGTSSICALVFAERRMSKVNEV